MAIHDKIINMEIIDILVMIIDLRVIRYIIKNELYIRTVESLSQTIENNEY